ncbi:hypothetical protein GCM10020221_12760 [Streptomyces thioluteus]|uniref:Glutamate racemase n=1 Tax=Streptomyces thioluteus TaxID=66431 RepID=A0ABN3WIY6_STRTU
MHRLRPDAELVLSSDPASMPWGPRTPEGRHRTRPRLRPRRRRAPPGRADRGLQHRVRARAAAAIRAELEPGLPVIGTVPAIKPAAAGGGPVAIWATPATTGSPYQRGLIRDFAAGVEVTEVPCPGLADAVERADDAAIDAPRSPPRAARTPQDVRAVVLGCTHYELVAERIRAAVRQPSAPARRPARFGGRGGRTGPAPDRGVPRPGRRTGRRAHRAAQRPGGEPGAGGAVLPRGPVHW